MKLVKMTVIINIQTMEVVIKKKNPKYNVLDFATLEQKNLYELHVIQDALIPIYNKSLQRMDEK